MANSSQRSFGGLLVPAAQVLGITTSAFLTGFGFAFSLVSIPVIARTAPAGLLAKQWLDTYEIGKAAALQWPFCLRRVLPFSRRNVRSPVIPCVSPHVDPVTESAFSSLVARDRKGFFPDMAFDPTAPWALYTAAAVAVPSIVPYTLLVMKPTTLDPLIAAAADASVLSTERTLELLELWKQQNYVRQMFGMIGAVLGAVATVM